MLQALPFKHWVKIHPLSEPEECCGAAMPLAGEIAAKVKGGYMVYLQVSCGSPGLHPIFFSQTAWWNPECFTIFCWEGWFFHLPVKECITILKMVAYHDFQGVQIIIKPVWLPRRTLFLEVCSQLDPPKYRSNTGHLRRFFGRTRVLVNFF